MRECDNCKILVHALFHRTTHSSDDLVLWPALLILWIPSNTDLSTLLHVPHRYTSLMTCSDCPLRPVLSTPQSIESSYDLCFGVYVYRVGGGFLSLALDPVYGHFYSVQFSLEYCTHYAQSVSINVYFLRVLYSNHTCLDVVFHF